MAGIIELLVWNGARAPISAHVRYGARPPVPLRRIDGTIVTAGILER